MVGERVDRRGLGSLHAILRIGVAASLAALGIALGQGLTPVPAGEAFAEEAGELGGIELSGVRYAPPTPLDLALACAGGGSRYGYLDTDFDGWADTLRVLGAAMVNRAQYEQAGTMVLGPLRNRATIRAQGAAAEATVLHIEVNNGDRQEFVSDLDSVDLMEETTETIRTQAMATIRGAIVTGLKVVSLDDDQGVCVIVRYDVPIARNNLDAGRTVPRAPGGDGGPGTVHQLPAPGQASDF